MSDFETKQTELKLEKKHLDFEKKCREESLRFEVLQFALEVARLSNTDSPISYDHLLFIAEDMLSFVQNKKSKAEPIAVEVEAPKKKVSSKLKVNPSSLLP